MSTQLLIPGTRQPQGLCRQNKLPVEGKKRQPDGPVTMKSLNEKNELEEQLFYPEEEMERNVRLYHDRTEAVEPKWNDTIHQFSHEQMKRLDWFTLACETTLEISINSMCPIKTMRRLVAQRACLSQQQRKGQHGAWGVFFKASWCSG